MFELKDRDAGGRITKWTIGKNKTTLPTIMPVINPNKMIVSLKEMEKMGCEIIITNSYIIKKNEKIRKQVLKKGLYKFFKWNKPIYTDSGTYQMFSQGIKDIDPEQIIEFQKKIKSDIITPLDIFTTSLDNKKTARKNLLETIKRIKQAKIENLVGPIQGGRFLDLRKKACKETAELNPFLFAIGGIVPLMNDYKFKELCDIILTCKENLPSNKPIHAFGCGHPITFALLVAMGCDLFDSAFYSLAAKRSSYITINGTHSLEKIKEFPCCCPVCSKTEPEKVKRLEKVKREIFLAKHNLYVSFQEIKTIRQAIRENSLFELVQERCRAHPKLLEAFSFVLRKYRGYFLKNDMVTKRSAFFYSGIESKYRPEVLRAKEWKKRVKTKKYFIKRLFGRIPIELFGVYPFYQSIIPDYKEIKPLKIPEKTVIRAVLDYQFGKDAGKLLKDFEVEKSKKTGRIKRIWKNKTVLGIIRAHDGFFLPTIKGAKILKKKMKRVIIKDKEVIKFIKKGSDVLAKFAETKDDIVPGEEVLVVDGRNKILAVGRSLLNKKEISEFERGVAVKIRGHI